MAPNVQLRYNSTIILVIHYQTHSDPYTKKDNFSTSLLTQFISKQEVVTDITLIEILQVLRTCYCNYSFTKPKNFLSLKIPNLMFQASDLALHHSLWRRVITLETPALKLSMAAYLRYQLNFPNFPRFRREVLWQLTCRCRQ